MVYVHGVRLQIMQLFSILTGLELSMMIVRVDEQSITTKIAIIIKIYFFIIIFYELVILGIIFNEKLAIMILSFPTHFSYGFNLGL